MRALHQEFDERLLIEAAQRDRARFAELYTRNFHAVYAYVARRAASRDETEDVTSEVFHQALAKLDKFEWRGTPFIAWLIKIAANTMADRWQKQKREAADPLPDEPSDHRMQDIERQAALFQLVEKLPPDQRRVIVMRFLEQKTIAEIAREFHRSDGAIKQLQFRALGKLRESLEGAHG